MGNNSLLRQRNLRRTDQGEGKDHALRCVLSLSPWTPSPSLRARLCCSQRAGALPLTPTKGSAPGPRLGSETLRTLLL